MATTQNTRICKTCNTRPALRHRTICAACKSRDYRRKRPDKIRYYSKTNYLKHIDRVRKYQKEYGPKHYQLNKERIQAAHREHYKKNIAWYRERNARRRARKLQATPTWVDRRALLEIYKGCPPGYHVDHIIPLNGKNVCGLHVPWNLQYLSETENKRKGASCQF